MKSLGRLLTRMVSIADLPGDDDARLRKRWRRVNDLELEVRIGMASGPVLGAMTTYLLEA